MKPLLHKTSRRSRRGFTLIELILVISIIAVLASLTYPAFQGMSARGHAIACQNNLRQLWVAVNAAATDNENRYPAIRLKPSDSSAGEDAKELQPALEKYGITSKSVQCQADIKGPNWFAKVHTSYMWQPPVEDETVGNVRIVTPRRTFTAKGSRVALITDYDSVHEGETGGRKKMHVVYVDGHVAAR